METVCIGKKWDVALAIDDKGSTLAALPYLLRKHLGMKFILQPQLTQFNGPVYFYPKEMSERRRPDFEKRAAGLLIDQLDYLHIDYFHQHFSPEVTNWLPYYWHGFKQTTRYTYRIADITDPDRVFDNFDRSKERQRRIRQIINQYTLDREISPEVFAEFHEQYWKSRGKNDLLTTDFMVHVMKRAIERQQGLVLGLRDGNGVMQTAWFAVYDERCSHALLSAMSPTSRDNGATALLIWHMIQALSPLTKAFDFEGSMDETTEYFYRSFGAGQVPYMQITRCTNPVAALLIRAKH